MNDAFRKPLPGTDLEYVDARAAVDDIRPGAWDRLPYTSRVLAENLVRCCAPTNLNDALLQIVEHRCDRAIPWYPARVVCNDILGQTALVDLAGLREAVSATGGDPTRVNPVIPTQLIVDHSLAVEHAGHEKNALAKNRAIEERRNADRLRFIHWARSAFKNLQVVPAGNGILHQINLEKLSPVVHTVDGVAFPDTLVGTDSHTPHVNALGVFAIGLGGLEAQSVMLGRACCMRLPDIVGVELTGSRRSGITATDIVLALTRFLRDARLGGACLEFFGEAVKSLTLGDRATISNMAPEFGATAAMFCIDRQTIDYLKLTGRDEGQIRLVERYARESGLWADSLAKVEFARRLRFDLSDVHRGLAGPSVPHRWLPTSELIAHGVKGTGETDGGQLPEGAVIIAAITSCTNTGNPRSMIAAGLLARNATARGLLRKPWVKTSLAPGSKTVALYLEQAGLLPELERLGFGIVGYACTTCNGMSGALEPKVRQEVIERDLRATAVLSGNRNYDGRIHPDVSQAFLASPPLVVAYAIAGTIRFDIERDALGWDADGQPVTLRDIWPGDEEIDAVVRHCVKPEQFRSVYGPMIMKGRNSAAGTEPLYDWPSQSTYVRRPPYWDGERAEARTLREMRPLAVLGDNITTDHLSPSSAILPGSAAAEYLAAMGLPEEDYNSYATHRGDHRTAQRATLANPRLRNEMVRDKGKIREGSLARVEPEGVEMRMWEAIETYRARRQPLIIVAGADYGQGSSRDWAAKGVRLAGVEAVVAESIERIHRNNLVAMGVLPLTFKAGEDRHTHAIDGTEVFDVIGEPRPGAELTLRINRRNGGTADVPVTCCLETKEEWSDYSAGGILQRFAQEFLGPAQAD